MKPYTLDSNKIYFRQSNMPAQWMTSFAQLGVYVHLTGSKRYPYSVELSESEFLSCVEIAKEM